MSYHLFDSTNINSINFDNLLIGKKISFDDMAKYYIYFIEDNNTPKEIYIKIPKVRLIYNIFNTKYKQISLPLYPLWNNIIDIIKFIKYLEQSIFDAFSNYNDLELTSIIHKKNNIDCIRVNINDSIMIPDVKINSEYEFVIKISYIWRKNNKIGLDSELYQINYFGTPKQNNINFFTKSQPSSNPVKIPEIKNQEVKNNNTKNNPKNLPTIMIPTLSDLVNMKSKLKKFNL